MSVLCKIYYLGNTDALLMHIAFHFDLTYFHELFITFLDILTLRCFIIRMVVLYMKWWWYDVFPYCGISSHCYVYWKIYDAPNALISSQIDMSFLCVLCLVFSPHSYIFFSYLETIGNTSVIHYFGVYFNASIIPTDFPLFLQIFRIIFISAYIV